MSTYEPLARPAWRPTAARVLPASSLAVATGVLVGLDQAAKLWIEQNLPLRGALPVWGDVLQLVHVANRGAVGGVGSGLPWLVPALAGAGALLIAALIVLYRVYSAYVGPSWRAQAFLICALAALFCTLLDRLRLGYVLDFVYITGLPVFNFGDLMPTFAVVFLGWEVVTVVKGR
ncbi:MAG: signal peptidase II [Chloroflexota bacterium]